MMRIAPDKLITPADRGALAALCQLYSRATEAERHIQVDGAVTTTTNGNVIQSPWVGMANKAWSEYVRLATEFGLTPSSRSRISLPEQEPEMSLGEKLLAGKLPVAQGSAAKR
jgi:P27 family predicted phage terminase small subunit